LRRGVRHLPRGVSGDGLRHRAIGIVHRAFHLGFSWEVKDPLGNRDRFPVPLRHYQVSML
jgi:hypothetical protein